MEFFRPSKNGSVVADGKKLRTMGEMEVKVYENEVFRRMKEKLGTN